MKKSLMILGTSSGAGKSTIVTGLCRILHQDGNSVAPFKSQNMTSNPYVFDTGLEIAKSQAIAAYACGITPDVDMNPVMLKLHSGQMETILCGKSIGKMTSQQYSDSKKDIWLQIIKAYGRLSDKYSMVILEGAGSPVEINLKDNDIVNMSIAQKVNAPVILVADIDRGGVFASVYGTLMLLSESERALVKGIVINRLKGKKEFFHDVKTTMEKLTGIPVLGMIPYMPITIEDEDSLIDPNTGAKPAQTREDMEHQFNLLAKNFREHMDIQRIYKILEVGIRSD